MRDCEIRTIGGPSMVSSQTCKAGRLFAKTEVSEKITVAGFNNKEASHSAMKGMKVILSIALLVLSSQLATSVMST